MNDGTIDDRPAPGGSDDVTYLGGEVKALGDGRVGGYLVRFGAVDVQGDLFDAAADFGLDGSSRVPVYYHHGVRRRGDRYSELFRNRRIGSGEVKALADGLWIEGAIDLARPGGTELYADVEAGRMGWSSGTSDRFVDWEPMEVPGGKARGRRITAWPLNDASLTPSPVEARNRAVTLKALIDGAGDIEASTGAPDDAAAAPSLAFDLLRLAADAERLVALSTKASDQRAEAGRDLSPEKFAALSAAADAMKALCERAVPASAPPLVAIDPAEFLAIIRRGRAALKPTFNRR